MAKRVGTTVLDAALNILKTTGTKLVACSAEPTNYTEANATYKLADVTIASGDMTLANGDGTGNTPRKLTFASKSGTVTTSGTATHIAVHDGTTLLFVTTCTSQGLTASSSLNYGSWKAEIGAPT